VIGIAKGQRDRIRSFGESQGQKRRAKDPIERQIFLPSEGFKGILAVPGAKRRQSPPMGGMGGVGAGRKFAFFVPRQSLSAI
jgi:hypothetical protein